MAVILRKRVMNTFMLDYSGEVFFFLWAQEHLKLKPGMLVHGIKDSNVLSAGAGLAMLYLMTLMLLASGGLADSRWHQRAWLALCADRFGAADPVQRAGPGAPQADGADDRPDRRHLPDPLSPAPLLVLGVEFWLWQLSGALPSAVASLQFVALRLVVTRLPLGAQQGPGLCRRGHRRGRHDQACRSPPSPRCW